VTRADFHPTLAPVYSDHMVTAESGVRHDRAAATLPGSAEKRNFAAIAYFFQLASISSSVRSFVSGTRVMTNTALNRLHPA
jgi:hypothetical protein